LQHLLCFISKLKGLDRATSKVTQWLGWQQEKGKGLCQKACAAAGFVNGRQEHVFAVK
jgi:hypothetical protein